MKPFRHLQSERNGVYHKCLQQVVAILIVHWLKMISTKVPIPGPSTSSSGSNTPAECPVTPVPQVQDFGENVQSRPSTRLSLSSPSSVVLEPAFEFTPPVWDKSFPVTPPGDFLLMNMSFHLTLVKPLTQSL
ncbi:hypothetical protein M8J76_013785 [Diaphorina citri]|nr:hypothetical protein M8J75_014533 [Diaphorina citri]KAI5733609.1 hypothetical protein M8J76_013785 [Diaphorina citri]